MDDLIKLLGETGIPFAYDHFAEGESPDPPFICYLLPQSDNFSADGKVYLKVSNVNIELYTDSKDLAVEQKLETVLDIHGIFMTKQRSGSRAKNSMKSSTRLKWRFDYYGKQG